MRKHEVDTEELMDEIRESGEKMVKSLTNIAKNVDWKSMVPKVVLGLAVVYGLRRHKLILSIVVPMIVGMIGKQAIGEVETAKA